LAGILDVDALEATLRPFLVDEFLPALTVLLNQIVRDNTDVIRADIPFPLLGVSIVSDLTLRAFQPKPISPNQFRVLLDQHPVDPLNRILLRIGALNVDLATLFKFFFGFRNQFGSLPLCIVNADLQLSFSEFELVLDIGVTRVLVSPFANRTVTSFDVKSQLTKSDFSVNFTPRFNLNACNFVASAISSVFNVIDGLLRNQLSRLFGGPLVAAIAQLFDAPPVTLNATDTQIFPGKTLLIQPDIQRLQGDKSTQTVALFSSITYAATLQSPAWRNGRYLVPFIDSRQSVSLPSLNDAINSFIRADSLDGAVQSIWYLAWATLTATQSAESSLSGLCKAIPTDPCPYPPLRQRTGWFQTLQLGLFFWKNGIVRTYEFETVMTPPSNFYSTPAASDMVDVKLTVRGIPLFLSSSSSGRVVATFNTTVPVSTTAPQLDPNDGTLSKFLLQFSGLENISLDYPGSWAPFLKGWLQSQSLRPYIMAVMTRLVSSVNANLPNAIHRLPSLGIPAVPISFGTATSGKILSIGITDQYTSLIDTLAPPQYLTGGTFAAAILASNGTAASVTVDPVLNRETDMQLSFEEAVAKVKEFNDPDMIFYFSIGLEGNVLEEHTLRYLGDSVVEELDKNGHWIAVP
jgi:hypothetical protein